MIKKCMLILTASFVLLCTTACGGSDPETVINNCLSEINSEDVLLLDALSNDSRFEDLTEEELIVQASNMQYEIVGTSKQGKTASYIIVLKNKKEGKDFGGLAQEVTSEAPALINDLFDNEYQDTPQFEELKKLLNNYKGIYRVHLSKDSGTWEITEFEKLADKET